MDFVVESEDIMCHVSSTQLESMQFKVLVEVIKSVVLLGTCVSL